MLCLAYFALADHAYYFQSSLKTSNYFILLRTFLKSLDKVIFEIFLLFRNLLNSTFDRE